MCGFSGIMRWDRQPVDKELLKRMTCRLAHRGPDDEGYFTNGNAPGRVQVGLGCRRLSIIDLSGGTLDIFLETVLPPVLVHVFGDAPIARALTRVGAALGYDITSVTDPAANVVAPQMTPPPLTPEIVLAIWERAASRTTGSLVTTTSVPMDATVREIGIS